MIAAIMIAVPSLLNLYNGHTGRLLIANKELNSDRFFGQTVIYIFDHSFWGAKGIIINKPMLTKEPEKFGINHENAVLFNGGPVAFPSLKTVALNRPKTASRWGVQPLTVIDYKGFEKRFPSYDDKNAPLNVYIGYAGWDVGQLENEIQRGLWTVFECNINDIDPTVTKDGLWEYFRKKDKKNLCPKK